MDENITNTRKNAREVAFKLVFEYLFAGETNDISFKTLAEEYQLTSEQRYLKKVYNGVVEHYKELIEAINQSAKGFSFDRIYKVDKAILLVSLYEITYMDKIPCVVSINEAVELAKKYGTEKSSSFVNGILNNLKKIKKK